MQCDRKLQKGYKSYMIGAVLRSVVSMQVFSLHPVLIGYELRIYEISARRLASPNHARSHLPHILQSSYEYLNHNQSEDSRAH
jgi:hypothetical protein